MENPLSCVLSEAGVVVGRVSPLSHETRVGGVVERWWLVVGKVSPPSVTRNASGLGCGGQENPPSRVLSEGGVVVGRVSPLSLETQVGGVVVDGKTPLSRFKRERWWWAGSPLRHSERKWEGWWWAGKPPLSRSE